MNNKIKHSRVSRSTTSRQLPKIGLYTPHARQNSSYFTHIANQISANIQYQHMDATHLNKEQKRLKNILKQINDDTLTIISNYSPHPIKSAKHRKTSSSILLKEGQNNSKILSVLQEEIQALKERSMLLHNHTKQQFNVLIKEANKQILQLQENIREIKHQNQERGKTIVSKEKIMIEGEIKKSQYECVLMERKAKKLRQEFQRVNEEVQLYSTKTKELEQKFSQIQPKYTQISLKKKQTANLQNNQLQYEHKKSLLSKQSKKKQVLLQNNQFKYYRLLKQLDQINISIKIAEQKTSQTLIAIESSSISVQKHEYQLNQIKRKKQNRSKYLNQFLLQTRMEESRIQQKVQNTKGDVQQNQFHGSNNGSENQIDFKKQEKDICENQNNGREEHKQENEREMLKSSKVEDGEQNILDQPLEEEIKDNKQ